MDHYQEALDLVDRAEQRQREDAAAGRAGYERSAPEPATPEQRQEQFATELAAELQAAQSRWITISAKP
jgi:hypothetical protein